jgi:hypothetical protein
VTALIVGDQARRAIMEGNNLCPRWTEHGVSDPGVTSDLGRGPAGGVKAEGYGANASRFRDRKLADQIGKFAIREAALKAAGLPNFRTALELQTGGGTTGTLATVTSPPVCRFCWDTRRAAPWASPPHSAKSPLNAPHRADTRAPLP